jgi:hypothetical protein
MFDKPTVFILGAGASWHYGYPTGEELVKMVIKTAGRLGDFCQACMRDGIAGTFPHYVEIKASGGGTVASMAGCYPRMRTA